MIDLIIAASLIASPSRATEPAISTATDSAQPDTEGFRWAKAYIEMLQTVQQSTHRTNPNDPPAPDLNVERRKMFDQITAGKEAMIDLRQAKRLILPFKKSKRKTIADAADTNCLLLDAVLVQYSDLNKIALSVYEGNMPKDYADRMTDIAAKVNFDWEQYVQLSAMSSYGMLKIPENKPSYEPNFHKDTMDFTESQRDDLLRRMEGAFGADVKDSTSTNGRSSVDLAPTLFYRALAQSDLKFAKP